MAQWPYTKGYEAQRKVLLASRPMCLHCGVNEATEADHQPPIALHTHVDQGGCCVLVPSCWGCARRQAGEVPKILKARKEAQVPEPRGFLAGDDVWAVSWLDGLRRVPADAVWPRLMTAPHPAARGTLGAEFCAWSEAHTGRALRWWQQLVAYRLLEVDDTGRLVWESCVLTLARQLGKSWLLRSLFLWRLHQADRFGEPQLILHTGRDLGICKEVQLQARVWAKAQPELYKVRETNGQEEIEHLESGSRWMLRAKEAVYGYSASLAGVDEAWKVPPMCVEEGLVPTMLEREQAQLVLVSTAHRRATALMVNRRSTAIGELAAPGVDLLIEWSSPRATVLDDPVGWRQASPHWGTRRERMVANALKAARDGSTGDPDEPDPLEAFRAQWLNQWPALAANPAGEKGELLIDADVWESTYAQVVAGDRLWIGLEDYGGAGAAVAAVVRDAAGRIGVDGWLCDSWEGAVADVRMLTATHSRYRLLVGASLAAQCPTDLRPTLAGSRETRTGLPLFRQLVARGMVSHEQSPDLDGQVIPARVTRATDGGLLVLAGQRTDLLRAVVWAVQAAYKPTRSPSIH